MCVKIPLIFFAFIFLGVSAGPQDTEDSSTLKTKLLETNDTKAPTVKRTKKHKIITGKCYKVIGKTVEKCVSQNDMGTCLQEEAASALSKAVKADQISLGTGIMLEKIPGTDIDTDRKGRFYDMSSPMDKIWFNLDQLISTRSLNIKLSDLAGDEESRGKKKKIYQYLGVALATAAAILIPIKLKVIGWMAATALFTGKLALVIASLVGLKKLVSKPSEETTHVHYDGHRSDQMAHYLAYSGQQPEETVE